SAGGHQRMGVGGNLAHGQSNLFGSAGFREDESIALMQRQPPAKIRKGECRLPIAPVRGSDQLEQRHVFGDRQQLPFAKHPSSGREVAREYSDFTNVWL